MPHTSQVKTHTRSTHPLLSAKERLSVVRRLRGIWKNRKPDPIKELEKIRKEWDRNTTSSP